jgi:DNA recombination protein RmuC
MEWVALALGVISVGLLLTILLRQRSPEGGDRDLIVELRRQVGEHQQEIGRLRAGLEQAQQARVSAETRLESATKHFEEQKRLLDEARTKLADTFKALSADVLKSNSEAFVKQAEERIKPLKDALEKYEKQVVELEKTRVGAYEGIRVQMKSIGEAHQRLQQETGRLVTALRSPHVRGRWGEITLKRVVEVAGMSPHCDFETQPSTETDEGRRRPDLIVRLPGSRTIVVDAKAPLNDYVNAVETEDDESRQASLRRHAMAVRSHMQSLSNKAYWSQFDSTPDFVVMFLPGESFFSAALEQDRNLIEDGFRDRVILATPTTLIALLRSVAYSWQQQDIVENAREIARTARELFERLGPFTSHFDKVGSGLKQAVGAFNAAMASWQSRVVPAGRRLPELGATAAGAQFPELTAVDVLPTETPTLQATNEQGVISESAPEVSAVRDEPTRVG